MLNHTEAFQWLTCVRWFKPIDFLQVVTINCMQEGEFVMHLLPDIEGALFTGA